MGSRNYPNTLFKICKLKYVNLYSTADPLDKHTHTYNKGLYQFAKVCFKVKVVYKSSF